MKKQIKLAIFGVGAFTAVTAVSVAISRIVTKNLIGEALDREEPKIISKAKTKLTGSFSENDAVVEAHKMAEKLENCEHERVEIESFDKTKLVGHLIKADNQKRVILAMHGWRSSWANDFCAISDFWRNNGCTVLYPEQRGQGGSDGKYMGFGMLERYDCLEWIKWLNENGYENMPIYLAGVSMGASTVLMTSGFADIPKNVKGIMADCGFTSAKAIWKHVSEKNLKISYKNRDKEIDELCRNRIAMNADAYSTLDAMQVNTIPVLFIHGTDDHFVPISMTLENYTACKAKKRLFTVNGADHGMSYLIDKDGYEKSVLEFFGENDI